MISEEIEKIKFFCDSQKKKSWDKLSQETKNTFVELSYECIDKNIGKVDLAHKTVKFLKNKNIVYERGKRIGVITSDKSMYVMSSDNNCFQSMMKHSIPAWDKILIDNYIKKIYNKKINTNIGPRISLTFRYYGKKQPKFEDKKYYELEKVWYDDCISVRVINDVGFSYENIYNLVKKDLKPDIAKIFNKTYMNNGRLVATYTTDNKLKLYNYGGKSVKINLMNGDMKKILERVQKLCNLQFNWVHIVYYPFSQTKLDWHSDMTPELAVNSSIAGISLFENKDDIRSVEFKRA